VLGVTADQYLNLDDLVSKVVSSCNYHIRIVCVTFVMLSNTIECSIVATRLDYCNAVLYGISGKNIMRLQRVQSCLGPRVVCAVPFRSSSDALFRSLLWLPIRLRITHEVATLTSIALLHHQLTYLYQNYGVVYKRERVKVCRRLTSHSTLYRSFRGRFLQVR